uniref:GNAT family N-acetyltransferase n=1 Tax=uncultured Erythrobacter sp. TaxID=263913 RepID=UPI002615199D|nr:GNAT family protein [uncultured Erythrobacter sp.]
MIDVQTLTTPRFTMRPLQREDCAALYPTLSDPDQCLYLTRPAFESEDELWGWLADPAWPGMTWIAVDAQGEVAGRFVAHTAHQEGVEEIGYIVCSHAQGQGVAKECTAALIAHRFASGARKLTAEVDTRNTASVRLLESLGFTREAHFRKHEVTHIGMCDVYWYGKLKENV